MSNTFQTRDDTERNLRELFLAENGLSIEERGQLDSFFIGSLATRVAPLVWQEAILAAVELVHSARRLRAPVAKCLTFVFLLIVLPVAKASELPNSASYVALTAASISATLLDSYTTGQFQGNYHAYHVWHSSPGDQTFRGSLCIIEGSEPVFYGRHPGEARAFAVGVGKIAASQALAIAMRRSGRHWVRRLWLLPIAAVGIDSTLGAAHNFRHC